MLTYDFLDRTDETLYEYLYRKIRQDILAGRLQAGERMPSKRSFAENLGISVITVETAYAQLAAEGYLYAKPRSGFYVERIGQSMLLPEISAEPEDSSAAGGRLRDAQNRQGPSAGSVPLIDLSQSGMASSMFPFPVWSRLMREILRTRKDDLLKRSPGNGVEELRTAIARHLLQFQDLRVSPKQIVVGAGTEYLYSLLIRLLGHDKIYAVETPGYRKTERIYASNAVQVKAIEMDRNGVNIEKLRASGADVIHITPSHQFPTGITMPVSRRGELLSWCSEENHAGRRYIIEDDYDSEFRLAGRPIPSLMSIDRSGSVIYLNTFTNSVSPSIRISYLVLPEELLREYRERLGFYSCTVANFEQYILAEFMRQGYFEKHINRMRSYYRQKRDRLLAALRNSPLGPLMKVRGADAGLHFLIRIDTGASEKELTALAEDAGVRIYGLQHYGSGLFDEREDGESPAAGGQQENGKPCMVVNYQGLTDEQIDALGQLLARAWALTGESCAD